MFDSKWKFLVERNGRIESYHGSQTWEVGQWVDYPDDLELYASGLHASPNPLAALGYVKGDLLAQVEVRGVHIETDDKSVHSSMRLTKVYRWSKEDSVALAVFAAEQVIEIFESARPGDDRPRKAIEAAKAWLADHSANARAAANAAAYAAYAAYAAADAAVDAAANAAYAANAAANAAADAAANAARAAADAAANAARAAATAARAADANAADAARRDASAELRRRISKWMIDRTAELAEWTSVHDG